MRPAWLVYRLSLLPLAAICVCVAGCGKAGGGGGKTQAASLPGINTSLPPSSERGTITTSAIPAGQRLRGDGDADNPGDTDGNGDVDPEDGDSDYPVPGSYRLPDADDGATFAYGHPPDIASARAIASVLERYYAAAAAADGAAGCSLLSSSLASSAPEEYGVSGPSYLRGYTSCQTVLSALFRHFHGELAEAITVVSVRVAGARAQVVFSSRAMPASRVFLVRRHGSWRILTLLGQPLS